MPIFTEEEMDRIVALFTEVVPHAKCSLCGNDDFKIPQGVIPLSIETVYPQNITIESGNQHLPLAAIVCGNCGNTYLINLRALAKGRLDDLLGRQ